MRRHLIQRRQFLALSGAAVAWPLPASGQQDARVRRVAYLNPAFATPVSLAVVEAWRSAMRELGWEEGRNIAIEDWWGMNQSERVRDQAADVVRRNVDLILAAGPAVRTVLATTQRIPIVAVDLEMDPVESGLVSSLARPGGNLTGQFLDVPQMCAKHLEMIREVDHRVSRIAVLGDPVVNAGQFRAMSAAAQALSVAVEPLALRAVPEDLERALVAIKERALQAVVVLPSPLANQRGGPIAELALQVRLPSVSLFRTFAESGGLMGYGPSLQQMFRRAADYTDRILKGASPADLLIERPVKFDLIINLKTAQTLGITIPPALLARADEVIE
ncbi:MAG TPA: ABC transporter substrate-binding protein [Alphaproteobacteria bacterium]|nr:ABC transporter substrate-binding protein [Alphaproteobacteria bacterium]